MEFWFGRHHSAGRGPGDALSLQSVTLRLLGLRGGAGSKSVPQVDGGDQAGTGSAEVALSSQGSNGEGRRIAMSPDQAGLQREILSQKRGRGQELLGR